MRYVYKINFGVDVMYVVARDLEEAVTKFRKKFPDAVKITYIVPCDSSVAGVIE